MLIAEYEVVPFGGRERELSDIVSWALGRGQIGVRLYHERGGVGKTRLAIEACKRVANEKLESGFLDRGATSEKVRQLFTVAQAWNASGLFVVIDYAESDSHRLRNLIVAPADFPRVHLRIVLLARGLGDWWESAKCEGDGIAEVLTGPATEPPIRLGPLGVSPEFRATELRRAAAAYATALGHDIPESVNEDLSAPIFERALLLHTFALLMVLQVPFEVKTAGSDPFLDGLWGREKRFLRKVIASRGMDLLLHDAAVMTLTAITAIDGVDDVADAVDVIRALPALSGTSELAVRAVARLLHDIYGGTKWIEPLQPDILAEYAIEKVFGDDPGGLNAVLTR